jgi:hypothetical protein
MCSRACSSVAGRLADGRACACVRARSPQVFTEEELSFICQICIDEDIILVTDEIYEHILFEPHVRYYAPFLTRLHTKQSILPKQG